MALYSPIEMVKSYSGKICQHSDVYFAKRNGTLYTGKICNPYKGEPSARQTAIRTKFQTACANTKTALADAEQRAAYETAFESQRKYKTLWGYAFVQEYNKLT